MTEIPEHLLKRSKDRQQSGATPSADVAATTPAAAPAAVEKAVAPVVPKVLPDPAYVAAAKSRKKIPFWAMATLSLLPLWAFLYVAALKPQEKVVEGPMAIGATVYGSCAGCHGAAGQGGAGRVFAGGEVLKTSSRAWKNCRYGACRQKPAKPWPSWQSAACNYKQRCKRAP